MIESQQIKKEAKNLFEQLISWRRQIHRHPETGLYLPVTAALVTKVLSDLGLEPKMVGTDNTTGVTALIDSGRPWFVRSFSGLIWTLSPSGKKIISVLKVRLKEKPTCAVMTLTLLCF